MPQAILSGKSVPKVVRVNAGDGEAVLYKNLGNGRRVPFLWSTTVTLASGTTSIVVASGVEFNDHEVSDGKILVTPLSSAGAALTTYVSKDTVGNAVSLVATGAPSEDCLFDVLIFLGANMTIDSSHTNQIWK